VSHIPQFGHAASPTVDVDVTVGDAPDKRRDKRERERDNKNQSRVRVYRRRRENIGDGSTATPPFSAEQKSKECYSKIYMQLTCDIAKKGTNLYSKYCTIFTNREAFGFIKYNMHGLNPDGAGSRLKELRKYILLQHILIFR
jgi:hypothetical protein